MLPNAGQWWLVFLQVRVCDRANITFLGWIRFPLLPCQSAMFPLFGTATIFSRHFGSRPRMTTTSTLFVHCAHILEASHDKAVWRGSGEHPYYFPFCMFYSIIGIPNEWGPYLNISQRFSQHSPFRLCFQHLPPLGPTRPSMALDLR